MKYPYGGWWIRRQKSFWSFVWRIITWPFRQRWTLIELILLAIIAAILIRAINHSDGFFKVHRTESISAPAKVHISVTSP